MARRRTPATGAPPGVDHPRAIFVASDIKLIRSLAKKGRTHNEIAARMTEVLNTRGSRKKSQPPVRKQVIGKILRGESYAASPST